MRGSLKSGQALFRSVYLFSGCLNQAASNGADG